MRPTDPSATTGSVPAPAARQTGRTGLVGILVPVIGDWYFSQILAGAAHALHEHDLRPVLSPTQHEHGLEVSLLDRLIQSGTDGTLIILPEESSPELAPVLAHEYPLVVIDPLLYLDEEIPQVSVANASGAEQATRHLLTLGHRRIAAITGPPGWVATEERRAGYHAALTAAGIPRDPTLEVEADFQIGPGAAAALALLALPEPPTAIFAFNDNLAMGAMQALRERGVSVPEEISIVGFDDVSPSPMLVPPLTTVRQPLAEMGHAAVRLLVRLMKRQRLESLRIELPTRLVVRESTAPPRPPR